MRIGVVGYSSGKFDEASAYEFIRKTVANIAWDASSPEIVSGLTDVGVPSLAYRVAELYRMKSVGIACSKSSEYPQYPCHKIMIVGDDWGDESETFVNYIDVLIRVGGGEQTKKETALFKKRKPSSKVYELDMDRE